MPIFVIVLVTLFPSLTGNLENFQMSPPLKKTEYEKVLPASNVDEIAILKLFVEEVSNSHECKIERSIYTLDKNFGYIVRSTLKCDRKSIFKSEGYIDVVLWTKDKLTYSYATYPWYQKHK